MTWNLRGLVPGQNDTKPPVFLKWRSSNAFIIFVVVFAVFTVCFAFLYLVWLGPLTHVLTIGCWIGCFTLWTGMWLECTIGFIISGFRLLMLKSIVDCSRGSYRFT